MYTPRSAKTLTLGAALALTAAPACNIITRDLLGEANPDGRGPPADARPDAAIDLPTDMLVVHYGFEDGEGTMAADGASRGLHATLSDPAMWTPNGRDGGGVMMSGAAPATQFVNLPAGLLDGVEDFTVAVWLKLSANPAWARIYDIGNGLPDPANRFMYLTLNGFTGTTSNGLHAASYGGSATNESVLVTHTFLPLNVWKHVALTGSGGERRIYIDGFPAAVLNSGPAIAPREMEPIAPNSWLGKSRFAADAGFPGTMDEFRVYRRVLTAKEIADLAWPGRDYSHWRFDDAGGSAAKDASDQAIPTALANGATWATGRLGGAVSFGGGPGGQLGPHVVLAGNPLASCTNAFTIAAWIRLNGAATGARILDFGAGTTHRIYLTPDDGAGMRFSMKSPAGTFDLVTATPPIEADAIWHHVAVTMDPGNVVVLYVDGVAAKTQPSGTIRPADFANLSENYLGRSRGGEPYLEGAIDELRIGCRALTPDEIRNLSRP